MNGINESWYTSNTQEWATPQKVFLQSSVQGQDNRVENLEWSNNSLNQKHAWAIGLQKVSNKAGKPRRKVRLYNDSESRVFDCVADAIRFLGLKSSANIQKVLHNYPHYYTIKGYKAEYYEPVQ